MPERKTKIWKTQKDSRVRALHATERYPGAFDDLFERAHLELEMWRSFIDSLPPPRCILKVEATPPDR